MGTSAAISIFDEENKPICTIIQNYDGGTVREDYLDDFVKNGKLTGGGIGRGNEILYKFFNGMNDFAAQLISKIKCDVGNVYLYAYDSDPNTNHVYEVRCKKNKIIIREIE